VASLFDVQRWTFDVRRSSPYGINVTWECLQNNLALMPTSILQPPISHLPPL